MPSANNKHLQKVLAPLLKAAGFRKDGATWRKFLPDAIAVLNIQGSQWGPSFYINLGTYFRALGSNEHPLESQCHLRARLNALSPDGARFNTLLDFEQVVPEDTRFRELAEAIEAHAIPWLDRVSTLGGAREYCLGPNAQAAWVIGAARALLLKASGV